MLPLMPTTRLLALGGSAVLDAADVAMVAYAALVGEAAWPGTGLSIAVAADPRRLPFVEGVFDAALAMTSLDAPGLRELWRVLGPAGVLVAVVPRRALIPRETGIDGAHHSRASLTKLLDAAMFEAGDWTKVAGVHVVRATKRDGLAWIGGNGTAALARLSPA
jgi:SAM-dependent methyltransferase